MEKPKVNSSAQKELDRAEAQFEAFDKSVKEMTQDNMNLKSVLPEVEPQVQVSNRELNKADAPHIKPQRSINSKEPFNEKFREQWKKAWEYIKCVVENNEIIGEDIEAWTKKFPGDPAHFWKLPVNKPIYIPRLLAEQLKSCKYHRLTMEERPTSVDGGMTFYGAITVNQTRQRLNARPVDLDFVSMSI